MEANAHLPHSARGSVLNHHISRGQGHKALKHCQCCGGTARSSPKGKELQLWDCEGKPKEKVCSVGTARNPPQEKGLPWQDCEGFITRK
eukprot:1137188-Pelagomonas_calceolata.AAC.2